jgi:hypothetical protein
MSFIRRVLHTARTKPRIVAPRTALRGPRKLGAPPAAPRAPRLGVPRAPAAPRYAIRRAPRRRR